MERMLNTDYELADIIYIFISPDRPGIMFYDRTPEPDSPEAKFAGSLADGKYLTDRTSISDVSWNDEFNKPNEKIPVKFYNGTANVTTIIVTEEKMREILDKILNCKDPNNIIIDTTNILNKNESINHININDSNSFVDDKNSDKNTNKGFSR